MSQRPTVASGIGPAVDATLGAELPIRVRDRSTIDPADAPLCGWQVRVECAS
jgi:hypothetical protein